MQLSWGSSWGVGISKGKISSMVKYMMSRCSPAGFFFAILMLFREGYCGEAIVDSSH